MTQVCGAFAPLSPRKIGNGCERIDSARSKVLNNVSKREKASTDRRSLDLSRGVLKVYAFIRQTATSHCPISLDVTLTARGICLSAGHESQAQRTQSGGMSSRACQGGKT